MNKNIKKVINALEEISTELQSLSERSLNNYDSDSIPLKIGDLIYLPFRLINKLKNLNEDLIDNAKEAELNDLAEKITILKNSTVNELTSYRGSSASNRFILFMQWIDVFISPLVQPDWQDLEKSIFPKELVKRVKQEQRNLDNLIDDKELLVKRIAAINDTAPLVDSLSEKLGDINTLEREISGYQSTSIELQKEILLKKEEAEKLTAAIKGFESEIQQIIDKANRAYKISTTNGLAGEFHRRAKSLTWSIYAWIFGLLIALGGGVCIGHERFTAVNDALKTPGFSPSHIWILIFLAVLSLGAPIWFAWLSTKQISQRFKLAEDYAFKATISKAYEGYRSEAIRINPDMEARLFASALSRLDEQPLRFVDKDDHGSPWQELLNNPAIMKLLKEKPESLVDFLKEFASDYFSKKQDA